MDAFLDIINSIAGAVLSFLPDSPFTAFIDELAKLDFLPYVNWFVPVGTLLGIGTAWLACISIYYIYQAILRWAKIIGG